MSTKQLIEEEIQQLDENQLNELYRIVKGLSSQKRAAATGLMAKLRGVHIDAPEDFASNLDQYASGEKRVS